MGAFSISHMVILLVIILLVFGAGRMPQVMKDLAQGIKAFRDGMKDPE